MLFCTFSHFFMLFIKKAKKLCPLLARVLSESLKKVDALSKVKKAL